MTIQCVCSGMAVARLDAAVGWYEQLLGRPPDMFPNDREAMWQLADTSWVYVVLDEERSGRGLLTLLVDDLDRDLMELSARGISTGAVESAPGLYRRVVLTDPDGNRIQLGEVPG
jgi:catechol 2,3-dioxygenase-like lactoylglutathione lyase family enzyme